MSDNIFAPPSADLTAEPSPSKDVNFELSQKVVSGLKRTRPWLLFFAILGFIFTFVIWVLGLIISQLGGYDDLASGSASILGARWKGFLNFLSGFLYLIPSVFLFKTAKAIRDLESTGIQGAESAMEHMRRFWKGLGVMVLLVAAVFILGLIGGILVP